MHGVQAVAGCAKGSDAHGNVLGVCQNAALACAIGRELCAGVRAGRADVENGADVLLHAVAFGDVDECLEVDVNIVLILRARVVD